ncbi:autoinducer binding domain-containing protein [Piscinibacter sp.]|uniref:autoinducer binding domain-containing protein n=1 Tax=Piscinibacter sp. TaxID=1903157 RepID=UPI0039E253AA
MRLQRFLDVSQSCDVETFTRRLVGFAHELDFGLATAAVVVDPPGQEPTVVSLGNTPEAYKDASVNAGDAKRDPVLRRVKRLSVPFVYDQSLYVEEGAADLWERQAPFGYRTGIAVALHLPAHRHFLLGVDREEALPREDEKLARLLADLQFLAVHAQDAAQRLLVPPAANEEAPIFTSRELDILRLTRDGKSAWSAGQILSISEHTVNFHLRNIQRKFNTTSKHQAVLAAMRLGLI